MEYESLLFSFTQHTGEIHWVLLPTTQKLLTFPPSLLSIEASISSQVIKCHTEHRLHRATGHEVYGRPKRARYKGCRHSWSWCRKAITAWQGHVHSKEKALTLEVWPLETCNIANNHLQFHCKFIILIWMRHQTGLNICTCLVMTVLWKCCPLFEKTCTTWW